jgi:hypothetical protein
MTDHPILFSGPMVRALLDGRKTQTRRVITKQAALDAVAVFGPEFLTLPGNRDLLPIRAVIGDRLWVRETWQAHSWATDCVTIRYRAEEKTKGFTAQIEQIPYPDGDKNAFKFVACKGPNHWRPGIHMFRWASRLTLTVTDVRVQRLQQISEKDAIAEGCSPFFDEDNPEIMKGPNGTEHRMAPLKGPRDAFRNLWDSLNADRGFGWADNPWVAAFTFTVHPQNIDQGAG